MRRTGVEEAVALDESVGTLVRYRHNLARAAKAAETDKVMNPANVDLAKLVARATAGTQERQRRKEPRQKERSGKRRSRGEKAALDRTVQRRARVGAREDDPGTESEFSGKEGAILRDLRRRCRQWLAKEGEESSDEEPEEPEGGEPEEPEPGSASSVSDGDPDPPSPGPPVTPPGGRSAIPGREALRRLAGAPVSVPTRSLPPNAPGSARPGAPASFVSGDPRVLARLRAGATLAVHRISDAISPTGVRIMQPECHVVLTGQRVFWNSFPERSWLLPCRHARCRDVTVPAWEALQGDRSKAARAPVAEARGAPAAPPVAPPAEDPVAPVPAAAPGHSPASSGSATGSLAAVAKAAAPGEP